MVTPEVDPDEELFPIQRDPRLRLIIPLVVAFAFLMEQIDTTIITTAIPQMARDLDTTVLRMNLAITAYILTLAVFIPMSGWLADRFGARRVFISALLVFTLSSALCGVATSLWMLVATRALQGLGGAMMTPVGRLILLRSFPRNQLVTAMAYMSLPALMGPIIGPLLGGLLTSYVSWRWIFYINLPFGALGILLALRFVTETKVNRDIGFDLPGFLLIASGVGLLQFTIDNIGHAFVPKALFIMSIALALGLLLVYGRYARRVAFPAVDLSLFHLRSFRISTLAGGVCRIGINGVPFLLPLMLQVGFGMTAIQSGSLTFFTSVGALALRTVTSRILKAMGFRSALAFSALLASVVIAGFAVVGPETPKWALASYIAVFGLIRAIQFTSTNTLSYADIAVEKLSRATSLGGVLQQLSVSMGVSLSAMLLGLVSESQTSLTVSDFHTTFLLIALVPLLSIIGFVFLKPSDGEAISGHQARRRHDNN